MNFPLEGIRVLDLSMYLPGPLCSQFLADFGAEVIKVEDPSGEWGRFISPFIGTQSARFYVVNRNKKSLSLNLKTTEGQAILKALAVTADVLIEQFRPGFMEKLGLDYEALKPFNEGLVYCAITGYGHTGPLKYTAGHDLNYLSLAGISALSGNREGKPGMSVIQIADIGGGSHYAVSAILLALFHRTRTGQGQFCDVAMFDGAINTLAYSLAEWSGFEKLPQRGKELLTGGFAFYNIYTTRDGRYVSLGAIEDKFWRGFCNKIGKPEFIPLAWDLERQDEMIAAIREIMAQKDQAEWVEFFAGDDICFTPLLTLEEMSRHPQVIDRSMIVRENNFLDSGKDLIAPGIPVKLSHTPGTVQMTFPTIGQHNEEILAEVGISPEELISLKDRGII